MPRGGRRKPGAGKKLGRPPKPRIEPIADRGAAARLIEALNAKPKTDEAAEVAGWRTLWDAPDLRVRLDVRKYLYDKRDGKAVQSINHIHDKPIDLNISHTVSERMMIALAKAENRVRNR